MIERCDNCHFSNESGYADWVKCRAHPPSEPGKAAPQRVHKLVRDNDWCGEWKEQTEAEKNWRRA